jgi:branched-chain amino acid transport system ATP-binding protein
MPLIVQNLSKSFGGVRAIQRVSLTVEPGERRVIIGPNGAGKSTLFNLIGGGLRPTAGSISVFGTDVTGWPPHRRAGLGLARTFQISSLFPSVSVVEHVLLAVQAGSSAKYAVHRPLSSYADLHSRAAELLKRWQMWDRREVLARDLSYGERRQLEIVIALAAEPRIVLLDEPTAGLSPAETGLMVDIIQDLPRDLTILLIEHDIDVAFQLADRVTVLNQGEILTEGNPAAIRQDQQVLDVYLGAALEV